MNTSFRNETWQDRTFTIVNYVLVTLLFLSVLYPLVSTLR